MRRLLAELKGEPVDLRKTWASYSTDLYRFCSQLCRNPDDAEDLAQDTMVSALRSMHQIRRPERVGPWLRRIALNRWLRIREERRVVLLGESLAAMAPAVPDPGPSEVERLAFEGALQRLPEQLRDAFVLVRIEGLKYREAAQLLEVPIGTVQNRVYEAMKFLQDWHARLNGEAVPRERKKRRRGRARS